MYKKLSLIVLLILLASIYSFADFYDDSVKLLTSVGNDVNTQIAGEMAKHVGFYTGSGNVFPANASSFLGLKAGVGVGVNMTPAFFSVLQGAASPMISGSSSKMASLFQTSADTVAAMPLLYDMVYLKIGLPVLPMDVGVRLGMIPTMSWVTSYGAVSIGTFHFGLEGRYNLFELPAGLVKVDARLSFDYDSGSLGIDNSATVPALITNNVNIGSYKIGNTYKFGWGGVSIGPKVVAGINIPIIGSFFGGLGMNLNFGSTTSTSGTKFTFTPNSTFSALPYSLTTKTASKSFEGKADYSVFDFRLLAGAQIFFVSANLEYGLSNGDLAITIIPLALSF
jgi:hypothetical protein